MSGYVHGRTDTTAALERQLVALRKARAEADQVHDAAVKDARELMTKARATAHQIIIDAIAEADKITATARAAATKAKLQAEKETNLIRERAYLEGRARADQERIRHDHQQAGTNRRKQLEHALRR